MAFHDFKKWALNHKGEEKFYFRCCEETHEHDSRHARDNALDRHILQSSKVSS